MPQHPRNAEHALFIGACFGWAMKAGLPVEPVFCDDGVSYSDTIRIDPVAVGSAMITLDIVVPEPPTDWRLG